jgi:hypothetical protein
MALGSSSDHALAKKARFSLTLGEKVAMLGVQHFERSAIWKRL